MKSKIFISLLVVFAACYSNAQITNRVALSKINRTINGTIEYNNTCPNITLWKNIESGKMIARVFNIQIKVSTVGDANTQGDLKPGQILDVQSTYQPDGANSIKFKISGIPYSINRVYIEIIPKLPSADINNIYIVSPAAPRAAYSDGLVINTDTTIKRIIFGCQYLH